MFIQSILTKLGKEPVVFEPRLVFPPPLPTECYPGGLDSKESAFSAGDLNSIPDSGRSSGEVIRYPLQYSCLDNSTDREAWLAIVHGVAKSRT